MRHERAMTAFAIVLTAGLGLGGCMSPQELTTPSDGTDTVEKADKKADSRKSEGMSPDSILLFDGNEESARLVEDMESGTIPKECLVLYDEEGMLPPVTVIDEATIRKVYGLLADVTVDGESDMSVTDSYHSVVFTLDDGAEARFSFEGDDLLHRGGKNYKVRDIGPLWACVRNLQAEVTGGNHVYAVTVARDDTDSIEDCPTSVEGGTWTSFVCSVDDEEVHAFANDKEIQKVSPIYTWTGGSDEKTPTGKKKFEFYMPEEDVEIKVIIGDSAS